MATPLKIPNNMIEAYEQGMGVDAILDAFQTNRRALYSQLARADVPLRRPRRNTIVILGPTGYKLVPRTRDSILTQTIQLQSAYLSGMLVTEIMRRFQVCSDRLYQAVESPDRHHRAKAIG